MDTVAELYPIYRDPRFRRHETLLLIAIAGAAFADWLFWGAPLGVSLALFNVALLALLLLLAGGKRAAGRSLGYLGFVIATAIAGLCISLAEEPTVLGLLLTTLGFICLALHRNGLLGTTPAEWGRRVIQFCAVSPFRIFVDNLTVLRWARRHSSGGGTARFVLRWMLPALFSAVFLGLFAFANAVVSKQIDVASDALDRWLANLPDRVQLSRVLFWIVVCACVYALLRPRISIRSRRPRALGRGYAAYMAAQPPPLPPIRTTHVKRDSLGLTVRCLIAFNVIFAIENGLDATYLFAGLKLPDGMSYAEYAHRGSDPLVAAALLAGAFILIAFPSGGRAEGVRAARSLVFAWLAQTIFLTWSAIWRLGLYVDAYSLTRLRLAAGIWMVAVVLGLAWIFLRIFLQRNNAWLLKANLFTALTILYACCFFDANGFVADYNVTHCLEESGRGPTIDMDYLCSLGPEALPALRRLTPVLNGSELDSARQSIATLEPVLEQQRSDWRGWTFRRERLSRLGGAGWSGGAPRRAARAH